MTQRLQELPTLSSTEINDWLLIKRPNNIDYKITFQNLVNTLVQTSDIGLSIGQTPALIAGTGGLAAIPQVSGENLTNLNLALPTSTNTVSGLTRLSDSVTSTSSQLSGIAATPLAVRNTYNLANAAVKRSGDTMSGNLQHINNVGLKGTSNGSKILPAGSTVQLIKLDNDDDILIGQTNARVGIFSDSASDFWLVSEIGNPANQYRIFNEGFMGAGSGLDADKLRGFNGNNYPRKAENTTITGTWTFSSNLTGNTVTSSSGIFNGLGNNRVVTLSTGNVYLRSTTASTSLGLTSNGTVPSFTESNGTVRTLYHTGNVSTLNANSVGGALRTAFGELAKNQTWTGANIFDNHVTMQDNHRLYFKQNATADLIGITAVSNALLRVYNYTDNAYADVQAKAFRSTQATGTAPFIVNSTTAVVNLNSDLLDGHHGSAYTRKAENAVVAGAWSFQGNPTIINASPRLTIRDSNSTGSSQTGFIEFKDSGGTSRARIGYDTTGNNNINITNSYNNTTGVKINGNTIWHAGNDGSGSGLDADTLDGLHSTSFARLTGANFTGAITSTGNITGYFTSDERLKWKIGKLVGASEKLSKLSGYKYWYKDPSETQKGQQYGLMAQEVESIMPELVVTGEDGFKRIKTGGYELVGLLVQGHKELSERLDRLEKLILGE